MRKYPRHKTDYPGVWFIEGRALPDKKTKVADKTEKIYYIAYRREGKLIEEKAGRQFEDRMTPAKASQLRARKKSGDVDSNSEIRLAGNDHYTIKQASGHKTDIAFQRYNLVTEEEIKGMKWLDENGGKSGTVDTYMDTIAKT